MVTKNYKPSPNKRGHNLRPEAGKATQFKKGVSGNVGYEVKSWSYRNQLRYIAAQQLDMSSPENLDASLKKLMKIPKMKKCNTTAARAVAVRMLEKALKKMEPAMVSELINNTEGRLPYDIQLPTPERAPEDQADLKAAYADYLKYVKL